MKVTHLITSLSPEHGGPSRAVPLMCEALIRSGVTQVMIAMRDTAAPITSIPFTHVASSDVLFWARLRFARDTIYHVNGIWSPFSTMAMWSLRRARCPYVLRLCGMLRPETIGSVRKRVVAKIWQRANVAGAALIHVTSEDELEAANACGWNLPPMAVIPNPIEAPSDVPHAIYSNASTRSSENLSVLYVGRLSCIKRLDLLLRSFALAHRRYPAANLTLAGPDSEGILAALKRTAEQLGVMGHVQFVGMQTQAQLADLFRRAHVAALVSRRENFGMAAAEAMAHGVPAVLTKHVGIAREAMRAGAALVVEDSPDAIAEGLTTVLGNEELAQAMSERARAFVQREYSPARVAKMMIEVYKWVLGQGPKPDCVRLD